MTDETNDTTEELAEPEPEMPEMQSFTLTTTRAFEMDFAERQLEQMVEQANADSPEEAIEQVFMQREQQFVEPEQKLLGVNVQVDGPSDD